MRRTGEEQRSPMARSRNRSVFSTSSGPPASRRVGRIVAAALVLVVLGGVGYLAFGNYTPAAQTLEIPIPHERFLRH